MTVAKRGIAPRSNSNKSNIAYKLSAYLEELTKQSEFRKIITQKRKNLNKFAINKRTKERKYDQKSIITAFSEQKQGMRPISAPNKRWKSIQEDILAILDRWYADSEQSTGFRMGYTIYDNAKQHLDNPYTLKIDLKDAFGTIKPRQVTQVFRQLGINSKACHALMRACTLDGKVAQGFATSPKLLNIIAKELDNKLTRIAKQNKLTYTRYADDLTFSSKSPISQKLINFLFITIKREGWEPARNKINNTAERYTEITGILLDRKTKKTLSKKKSRKLTRYLKAIESKGNTHSTTRVNKKGEQNQLSYIIKGNQAYEILGKGKATHKPSKQWRAIKRLAKLIQREYWNLDRLEPVIPKLEMNPMNMAYEKWITQALTRAAK